MMSPSSSRRGVRRATPLLIAGIVLALVLAVAIGLLQSMRDASAAVIPVPWPGPGDVAVLDTADPLPSDISGLDYEPDGSDGGVLWAVRNGPTLLYRLVPREGSWKAVSAEWEGGRTLTYSDGEGSPDAEGIALSANDAENGIFLATERDNDDPEESSLRVLRFDPFAEPDSDSDELAAVQEWDLSTDFAALPEPNRGFEGIAYVSDEYLLSKRFVDENTGRRYDPASYGEHWGGVFFLGLEETGMIHGYVLADDGAYQRIATIDSGLPMVAELDFDPERGLLWAVCDDACAGETTTLGVKARRWFGGGHFAVTQRYHRPAGLPDTNNEGFAVASEAECVDGVKPVYWADDAALDEIVLRVGAIRCS